MPKFLDVTSKSAARTALGLELTTPSVKTASYTISVGEIVRCDATSGGFTVTLPTAPEAGAHVVVRKIDTTTNTVVVQRGGSTDVFNVADGPTTLQLATPGQAVVLRYTAGIWHTIGHGMTLVGLDQRYFVRHNVPGVDLDVIRDRNGANALGVWATGGARNYVGVINSPDSATPVKLQALGVDDNINLGLYPKGTGFMAALDGNNAVVFRTAGGGSGYWRLSGGTNSISAAAEGSAAAINVNLEPKGVGGAVTVNNVSVINSSGQVVAESTGNAATATKLATARTISGVSFDGSANITVNNGEWVPADFGYKAWAFDPIHANTTTYVGNGGTLYLIGVKIPHATTISTVHLWVSVAGSSLTTDQCFAGLYQGGNRLASTATQHTAWATTGLKSMNLASAQSVTAGLAYVAFYYNGTDSLRIGGAAIESSNFNNNGGLASNFRHAIADTGLTTGLPATLATQTGWVASGWAAVS